jgi:hypothetical protein
VHVQADSVEACTVVWLADLNMFTPHVSCLQDIDGRFCTTMAQSWCTGCKKQGSCQLQLH